jgi:hypothetical protein
LVDDSWTTDLVDDGFGGRWIWWTTDFGGRWICMDDAGLYGRPITKRAILVDDGFWWTMRICMDDGRFVWTMVDLYGRPITKRVILVDDGFVWTTDY